MLDGPRRKSRGRGGEPPPRRRKSWHIGTVIAAAVAAAASTAVLANAVPFAGGASQAVDPNPSGSPDLIVYNGKITTEDPSNPEVQAVAIRGGDIVATGNDGPIRAMAAQRTQVVNLNGRRVIPGMIDSHIHALRMGYHCWDQAARLDLVTKRADALKVYTDKAAKVGPGKWLWTESGGWSVTQLDNPTPFTFAELTAAAPNNPVWVTGGGISGARVNQKAFDVLGLTPTSPGVAVDASGNPTGAITGAAATAANNAILAQLDAMSIDQTATCLGSFIKDANSVGLTGWADAVGNTAPWGTDGSINSSWADEALTQLYRDGNLHARVGFHEMSNAYGANPLPHSLASLENAIGLLGDDMVRYLGPGEDFMATQGQDYIDYAKFAAKKRLSVETHVGGNIGNIISGMEAANAVEPVAPLKWRIAHPDQTLAGPQEKDWLDRAKAMNVGWALTFSSARTGGATPPYKDVMNNSAHMCLGTDAFNVAAWNPFQMIWMVTTGQSLIPGVTSVPAAQRLTRSEALKYYTAECAWFIDQDGRLGQLKPGYHADFSVLDNDYFTVADEKIKDLKSLLTVVGGKVVYTTGTVENESVNAPSSKLGDVGGVVTPTLALSLGAPASFGAFTPGIGKTYTAQTTANVVSSAGNAALSVADSSSTAPGHLVNGAFSLAQPLKASAASTNGTGSAAGAVSGSPLTLVTYGGPVSNDAATVALSQDIGANEALRTGSYGKTLTFTLSTTSP
jgi:predicted amidohydrolase YtcJ